MAPPGKRSKPRTSAGAAASAPSGHARSIPASSPPHRHPVLLVVSLLLLAAWTAYLTLLVLTAR